MKCVVPFQGTPTEDHIGLPGVTDGCAVWLRSSRVRAEVVQGPLAFHCVLQPFCQHRGLHFHTASNGRQFLFPHPRDKVQLIEELHKQEKRQKRT